MCIVFTQNIAKQFDWTTAFPKPNKKTIPKEAHQPLREQQFNRTEWATARVLNTPVHVANRAEFANSSSKKRPVKKNHYSRSIRGCAYEWKTNEKWKPRAWHHWLSCHLVIPMRPKTCKFWREAKSASLRALSPHRTWFVTIQRSTNSYLPHVAVVNRLMLSFDKKNTYFMSSSCLLFWGTQCGIAQPQVRDETGEVVNETDINNQVPDRLGIGEDDSFRCFYIRICAEPLREQISKYDVAAHVFEFTIKVNTEATSKTGFDLIVRKRSKTTLMER